MSENNVQGAADTRDALLENSINEFNKLMGNMFTFGAEDKAMYDLCYQRVFSGGASFSYMSATFFAQFAGEILVGLLASNPFRRFIENALNDEAKRETPGEYWEPSMVEQRFGIPGRDYQNDLTALFAMMNESYTKILSLNNWYGTPDGKKELDMYCLSRKAVRCIRRAVDEFPYLIRRYDFDKQFAGEIMEYAGIVAAQIRATASESDEA